MKFGAATVHRTFGVPVGFCGPIRDKHSVRFVERQERLRAARLFVLDEFSMIGRQMLGKIFYKVRECLPGPARCGGKDVVLSGDVKQAAPIGDELLYRTGPYEGKGVNKPHDGEAAKNAPSPHQFTKRW